MPHISPELSVPQARRADMEAECHGHPHYTASRRHGPHAQLYLDNLGIGCYLFATGPEA